MEERLNELEEKKKIILQKVKDIDTKKLSKKWKILYWIGYIAVIAITTIIFYPKNMMLALLSTIVYGAGMPALDAVLDNSKRNKLRKQYSSICKEIEEVRKELVNQLVEETLTKDIPITSYKQYKELEEKVLAEFSPSEQERYMRENEKFFFGEGDEDEDILKMELPDDKEKGYTRKRKR